MDATNPLLRDTELPAFSAIRPEHIEPAISHILAEYRDAITALTTDSGERSFANTLLPQEALEERLGRAWSPVSHLHSVKDSEPLRKAYSAALEAITEHATELGQNRELFAAVQAVSKSDNYADLDRPARTLTAHALRDFHLSGVALEEPARSRFKTIANELSRLATEFEEAVLDASEAWSEALTEVAQLAGIPESGRAVLAEYAREKNLPGWLVTLKQPSVQAVLTYADDRELRRRVYTAHSTRASDQGPHAGQFDNSTRIEQILSLRHEAARLLGFANAAEESLATKMAPSPQKVLAFLHDLVNRAKPVAQRELAELRAFAASELGIPDLQSWDTSYAAEKLRERRFQLNEEELKPYFPLDAVLNGLFSITERVFGVRMQLRDDVDVWHADVRYYDVLDAAGKTIAGTYVDLYARSAKRGGAWMDVCRSRFREGDGLHRPVAYLTCNFAPPTMGGDAQAPQEQAAAGMPEAKAAPAPAARERQETTPSLLTHDDVLTLFHEFGHGLHHLLTEVDYPSVSGISGVEWDAVELPSQFLENFGWQRETLDLFARHYQTGESLPQPLYERMQAARHFQAGMFLVRQLEFALFDFRLHLEFDPTRAGRVNEVLADVRAEVAVLQPPAWQRFAHNFTHIFAGGYGAGYYSYLWAEVLSADAFDRFEAEGVFNRVTGAAFRREILAVGGSRPALESFVAFRGREPDATALLKSYGLA